MLCFPSYIAATLPFEKRHTCGRLQASLGALAREAFFTQS